MTFFASIVKTDAAAKIGEGVAAFGGKLIRTASLDLGNPKLVEVVITVPGLTDPEQFRTYPRDLPAGAYYRVPADKLAGGTVALVA